MHLTVRRELRFRLGDYESVMLSAEAGCTHRDFAETDASLEILTDEQRDLLTDRMQAFVKTQLDTALGPDIADVAEISGDRKSFVHLLVPETAPPAPPARTARRRTSRKD